MKKKVVFLPYDFDTAIGINNEGSLVFGYGLEDVDQTEGGADVFNGQQSVLWKNLRETFGPELKAMYQQLRSKGTISYAVVEKMFEDHQAKWPESIFNEDAWYKYLAPLEEDNNAAYLAMLQGSKASQRKWWLSNRFQYLDSKYNAGDALTEVITVRGYAKADISVTPYADIYAAVKYGSYLTQQRAKRGETVTLECPLDNVNDTEIYVYSASQIASVGDLSGLQVGYADFSKAVKLQNIKLGDAADTYNNGNLQTLYLGNNTLLQTIDVRNCSGLGTGDQTTVDISGCKNVRQVYFDGTKITGVTLPDGGVLETLHLPATITILKILNQNNLADFTCPDMSHITTLWLDNVSAKLDVATVLSKMPEGSRVRLFNFEWELSEAHDLNKILDMLSVMRGLDQNGNNTDEPQILGTTHIPVASDWLLRKAGKYPDLKVTYDSLYQTVLYYNYDETFLDFELVDSGKNAKGSVTAERPMSNSTIYTFDGWASAPDGEADSEILNTITEEKSVYAHYKEEPRYYRVRFYNGRTLADTQYVVYGGYARYYDGKQTPVYQGEGLAEDYIFIGWDKDISHVTEDIDTYAQFQYSPVYTRKFLQNKLTTLTDKSAMDETFPQITNLGAFAFTGSTAITELMLPNLTFANGAVPAAALATLDNVKTFRFASDLSSVLEIGEYAFSNFMGARANKDSSNQRIPYVLNFPKAVTVGASAFGGAGDFDLLLPAATEVSDSYTFSIASIYTLNLSSLATLSNSTTTFRNMYFLEEMYLSSAKATFTPTKIMTDSKDRLRVIDMGLVSRFDTNCQSFSKLEEVILRNDEVVTFSSTSVYSGGIFGSTSPIGKGTGHIYVPESLLSEYKAAAGWSRYADQFVAIEGSKYEIKKDETGDTGADTGSDSGSETTT